MTCRGRRCHPNVSRRPRPCQNMKSARLIARKSHPNPDKRSESSSITHLIRSQTLWRTKISHTVWSRRGFGTAWTYRAHPIPRKVGEIIMSLTRGSRRSRYPRRGSPHYVSGIILNSDDVSILRTDNHLDVRSRDAFYVRIARPQDCKLLLRHLLR